MSWKTDNQLKEDLEGYVQSNYKKIEILEFVRRDYGHYFDSGCSIPTLSRILSYFGIKYVDYSIPIEEIKCAIEIELNGAGTNLGYRAMTAKIRQKYCLNVSRDVVYAIMSDIDSEGLQKRKPPLKQVKRRNKTFASKGVNWFLSIDGHDKMMGYQNSTFPIAIYGMMDQASRKILMLKCWTTNSDPKLVGMWYLQWLKENRVLPNNIRLDKGTETGKLAAIHSYLRARVGDLSNPTDCIIYGPSTSNQIERWWRDLHERLEKRLKREVSHLLSNNIYNPHSEMDRNLLSFIMIPLVQRELDEFKETVWNTHRIRKQKGTILPDGVPNIIYEFPQNYGLEQCGFHLHLDVIEEAYTQAGVYPENIDFLHQHFREICESFIPLPGEIPVEHIKTAFEYLKVNVTDL